MILGLMSLPSSTASKVADSMELQKYFKAGTHCRLQTESGVRLPKHPMFFCVSIHLCILIVLSRLYTHLAIGSYLFLELQILSSLVKLSAPFFVHLQLHVACSLCSCNIVFVFLVQNLELYFTITLFFIMTKWDLPPRMQGWHNIRKSINMTYHTTKKVDKSYLIPTDATKAPKKFNIHS